MRNYLLFILFTISGFSQNFMYRGSLNDSNGAIPGANICIKGTKTCTQSDFDGTYKLRVKIGDQLIISMIGMNTKEIIVDQQMINNSLKNLLIDKIKVEKIVNKDFLNQVKSKTDTSEVSKSSGKFSKNDFPNWSYFQYIEENNNLIKLISKNYKSNYSFKTRYNFTKLFLELNTESTFSQAIRQQVFQKKFSQGRSLNGNLSYQSPETNENFSWGPNINSLENGNIISEYYPNGNLDKIQSENSKPIDLFSENSFYKNIFSFKTSISATIKNQKEDFFNLKLNYNRNESVIPNNENKQINGSINFFKNLKNGQSIESILSYNNFNNDLSNFNFVVNKINFANAITPIHFENKLNLLLENSEPRSFSSLQNNPYYLLKFNEDKNKSNNFSLNLKYIYKNQKNSFKTNVLFQNSKIENTNSSLANKPNISLNFDIRNENYKTFNFSNIYNYDFRNYSFIETRLDYRYEKRDLIRAFYKFNNSRIENSTIQSLVNQTNNEQDRHNLVWNINGQYKIDDVFDSYTNLVLNASTDLNYSSTSKNKFLNNFNSSISLENVFRSRIDVFSSFSVNQIEPSIQNNNLNFNTLKFKLSDFNNANNQSELFTTSMNSTTTERQIAVGIKYYKNRFEGNINIYHKKVSDLYAPILENNQFLWKPAINYYQDGLEIDLKKNWYFGNQSSYNIGLNLSIYRNQVTKILNEQKSIAFSGFSDINKSYIEGQPLGVIVGNGYLRNQNNQIIIDSNGFPVKDLNPKIIGNPNPDFVIGLDNNFKIKKISFNLTFDWQKGGQIWNGTQQALNYYGKSFSSEKDRTIQNYVFEGVTQSGQTNIKKVSFYDPNLPTEQNRWVRYGIEGLSEDNIEDASYFRLNNFSISYDGNVKQNIMKYKISLFASNLFIFSKNNSSFINNSLFNSAETTGLDYFNSPMTRSTGISITVKY